MSSVILDSEASFRERCSKIGLSNDLLSRLIDAGYNTFGKLAFAASATPQGLTDEAVDAWLSTVVTPAPSSFQVSVIRRLLFESQSLNVADLKSRVEGTPEGSVRRLPQAERKERIEAQHRRLSGLILTSHATPAHSCIDLVTDMYENNTLKYIPINRWISRFQEMSLQKKDSAVQMDNEGNLKVIQKKPEPTCDTTGMYPLRQAFQRRSLAFDLGHLCSFEAMETWINKLFEAVQRTVPKGYVAVSLGQVVTADRELFVRLADMLEGQLQKPIGVEKPMDAALRDLSGSQEITQFLQPLVAPPAPHPTKRPFKELATPNKGDGKGKTSTKGGEKGGGKAPRVTIPDGSAAKDHQGKPNCFGFNLGTCKLKGPDLVATSDPAPSDAEALAQAILARGSGITKRDVVQIFDLLPKEIPSRGASSQPPSVLAVSVVGHTQRVDYRVFGGGGIWIADGCGPHTRSIKGDIVKGSMLSLESPVTFDAFKYPHETESWVGDRLVCVAFTEQPPVKSDSWVYELFAGSARFSKEIFWDLIKECPPFHLHASPPAGLPSLSAASQQSLSVRKDNVLYRFVYKLLLHCSASGINVSVENPRTSLFWKVLQCFAEADGLLWPPAALEYVDFDQCCHGSDRPKSTRFLCTRGLFTSLRATCPGNHEHRPWGLVFHERSMQLSSSLVSAYPVLLCKRMASCLESAASFMGLSLQASPDLAASSVAVLGRQHRRFPPLIPEFRKVTWEPPSFQPDDSCRILLSQAAGEDSGREKAAEDSHAVDNDHVAKALTLKHPVDTAVALDQDQLDAISFCMKNTEKEVVDHRKLQLLKIKILAKKFEADEARLHSSFDPWFEKVVAGKRLLLWKHLLEQNGFDDMQVCDFMMSGVPIVGQSACPQPFNRKIVPATMSEQDLKGTASFRRKVMLGSSGTQAADLQELLSKATMDEVDLGFLEGPYTESQVSSFFHSDDWNCIRSFLILQGAENKPRPIDDGHEALINNCFTATIKLELQSSDFVAALAARIAIEEAERSRATGEPPRSWLGKCLDLSKAYKQMPMKKEHRSLAVIYHKGPSGEDQFFIANSLLFGLTASVYGFVRTSRSLHKLLLKIFKLPSSVYFDDYPMFSTSLSSSDTDGIISEFLDILGWGHAKTGSKSHPFAEVFSVLGMQIDLSNLSKRSIVLSNKPGRIDRIVEKLESVAASGFLTVHQAQILLGLLNFSSGFFAGRALKHSCKWLSGFLAGDRPSPKTVSEMCKHTIKILVSTPPRFISCDSTGEPPILVWTDGAWEPAKAFAGIGAVILDASSGVSRVFQGQVPERLVVRWREEVGEQIICEVELYALLMIRACLQNFLSGKRIIFFIDNDAARSVVLRGQSRSDAMHRLAMALSMVEAVAPCISWIERVPSSSNIADWPSRGEGWKAQKVVRAAEVEPYFVDQSLIDAYLL
ncbi:unnamed protein product [Symbiodinium sp. CCMP2592]|nr:unnamed protein product [Symbiodinium sp. CCMP2592]